MIQHRLPLIRWHASHRLGGFNRSSNRSINRGGVGQCDAVCDLAAELVRDFEVRVWSFRFIGEIVRIRFHDYSASKLFRMGVGRLNLRAAFLEFVIQDSVVFGIVHGNFDQMHSR